MSAADLALCYGTRPQTIKAAIVRTALGASHRVLAVDTGQHYDYALNALLYEQLGVAPPDLFLEVGSGSHAEQTSAILVRVEAALLTHRPRAVVVIGDTNSTLGAALAAAKLRLPVVHIEAGLRARDTQLAEEINRRAVSVMTALHCTPSASATRRLGEERAPGQVVETGDVAHDVLHHQLDRLPVPAAVVPGLGQRFAFATLHRAELVDHPALLGPVLRELGTIGLPVLFAAHPRTRAALDRLGGAGRPAESVRVIPAVGYLESLALARAASVVITDSGGVQREAYWLGTPCVTVRAETEWTETLECGANRLAPPRPTGAGLAAEVAAQFSRWPSGGTWDRSAYGDGHAGPRIARAVAELLARTE